MPKRVIEKDKQLKQGILRLEEAREIQERMKGSLIGRNAEETDTYQPITAQAKKHARWKAKSQNYYDQLMRRVKEFQGASFKGYGDSTQALMEMLEICIALYKYLKVKYANEREQKGLTFSFMPRMDLRDMGKGIPGIPGKMMQMLKSSDAAKEHVGELLSAEPKGNVTYYAKVKEGKLSTALQVEDQKDQAVAALLPIFEAGVELWLGDNGYEVDRKTGEPMVIHTATKKPMTEEEFDALNNKPGEDLQSFLETKFDLPLEEISAKKMSL